MIQRSELPARPFGDCFVRKRRLTVAWVMGLVAFAALNFAEIRAWRTLPVAQRCNGSSIVGTDSRTPDEGGRGTVDLETRLARQSRRGRIMARPRIAIRGLMFVVIVFGIALHTILAAVRITATKEFHAHIWVNPQGVPPSITCAGSEQAPFWPRYWRYLLGLPWMRQPLCPKVGGRLLDMCVFAHPEIQKRVGVGQYTFSPSQSQIDLMTRLSHRTP